MVTAVRVECVYMNAYSLNAVCFCLIVSVTSRRRDAEVADASHSLRGACEF